ncbi:MAG: class I SAM-dependent methyltransferase [candidate division Zixibacteria bacterium]|nr:class I SAM-dependent methyltransferase [candidate division Zixibacteria bacterium]
MNSYYAKRAPEHDTLMGYTDNLRMENLLYPLIRRFEKYIIDQDVLEIACGTGNWTQVLSKRAHSVLATDINHSVLEIAKNKSYGKARVTFRIADAYALQKIKGKFTLAFAADWWSHIPRSMIPGFVKGLHTKLVKGAKVIFVDMLPRESLDRMFSHYDEEGNLIHKRSLSDGEEFYVVKNFPAEKELKSIFEGKVGDFEFYQDIPLKRWMLAYTRR